MADVVMNNDREPIQIGIRGLDCTIGILLVVFSFVIVAGQLPDHSCIYKWLWSDCLHCFLTTTCKYL